MRTIFLYLCLCTAAFAADVEVHVVEQVKDGDTVALTYAKHIELSPTKRMIYMEDVVVRFLGFDACETRRIKRKGVRVTELEVERGKQAKAFLADYLKDKKVMLRTDWERDVYGRLLGTLIVYVGGKWLSVNDVMTDMGFSRKQFEAE